LDFIHPAVFCSVLKRLAFFGHGATLAPESKMA
jgi:hypothetical protein